MRHSDQSTRRTAELSGYRIYILLRYLHIAMPIDLGHRDDLLALLRGGRFDVGTLD